MGQRREALRRVNPSKRRRRLLLKPKDPACDMIIRSIDMFKQLLGGTPALHHQVCINGKASVTKFPYQLGLPARLRTVLNVDDGVEV